MKPNLNSYYDQKPIFDCDFFVAAGPEKKSFSWSVTQIAGRQAGVVVFVQSLILSIVTATESTDSTEDSVKCHNEELNDKKTAPGQTKQTLAMARSFHGVYGKEHIFDAEDMRAIAKELCYECEKRYGTLWSTNDRSFTAQDDSWTNSWGARTGIPLENYKQRWESLPEATATRKTHMSNNSVMSKTYQAFYNLVKMKAQCYMGSNPGIDNSGNNTDYHPGIHRLVSGEYLDLKEISRLNEVLEYRMSQMAVAEVYCYFLGIGVPDDRLPHEWDEWKWYIMQAKIRDGQDAEQAKAVMEEKKRFEDIRSQIYQLGVFDKAQGVLEQGQTYVKPIAYLAARLAKRTMPLPAIVQKLKDLIQCMYCLLASCTVGF
jgi:hypothetical protein